jgi:hypothetical protein
MAIRRLTILAGLAALTTGVVVQAGCAAADHAASTATSRPPDAAASTPTTASGTLNIAPSTPVPTPGSGRGSPPAQSATGITGVTVVDGGCPVIRLDSPCPDRPIQARLDITQTDSGKEVAIVDTDASGHFHIALPPGRYDVHAANPSGAPMPRAAALTTTVEPGRYTTLTIRFDSGIR